MCVLPSLLIWMVLPCWAWLPSLHAACSVALIVCCLSWVWMGLLCMQISQCPINSATFLGSVAPHLSEAAVHSTWGSPLCGYLKALLALQSFWVGQFHMCLQECPSISPLYLGGAALHSTSFYWLCILSRWGNSLCVCNQLCVWNSTLAGSISVWRCPMSCYDIPLCFCGI